MTAWSRWCIIYISRYFCYNELVAVDTITHYDIMKKVRNHLYLDVEELEFMKTFSKEQLFEIVEIVNANTVLMTDLIQDLEK